MVANAGVAGVGAGWKERSSGMVLAAFSAFVLALMPTAGTADNIVARVNGKPILESEMALADAEIGTDLGSLPGETKRRVLVEYLIETQLLAEAAERASLGVGANFDQRLGYWRRKALRDAFFNSRIKALVTDAEARRSFDSQVAGSVGQVQVKVRHILVDSEDKAKEVVEKIAHGAEFSDMARQYSKDPGSRDNGGNLGYFGRGQMVPQFEEAAFKLAPGEFSQPVKSQFGWHIIRVDDRRE
ncbi:MAG: peptidylprolyl isomerase, partial [Hyphomicrobiaceae bacterium]